MLDTLIVIAIFVLFYFILVRPLQKKYGHGTYHTEKRGMEAWWTDPADPRSAGFTKDKEW